MKMKKKSKTKEALKRNKRASKENNIKIFKNEKETFFIIEFFLN